MSLTPPAAKPFGDSSTFQPAPVGTHLAICYGVVDMGLQLRTFKDPVTGVESSNHKPKITLKFELPFCLTEDGRPQMCQKDFWTYSLIPPGKTRKDGKPLKKSAYQDMLERWIGKDCHATDFHPTKLIGRAAQVTLEHVVSGKGNTYAKITSIVVPMAGLTIPPMANAPFVFDLLNFKQDAWDRLSAYDKNVIEQSPEFKELQLRPDPVEQRPSRPFGGHNQPNTVKEELAEDIPF